MMREYFIALALFSAHYHSGQWSKLYRVGCQARQYLRREWQILSPEGYLDQPRAQAKNASLLRKP